MKLGSFYRRIGEFLPLKQRGILQDKINKAGGSEDAARWFGKRAIYSVIIGLLFSILPFVFYLVDLKVLIIDFGTFSPLLVGMLCVLSFFIGFAIGVFGFYLVIYYSIVSRSEQVERVLPEFLLMIAANLRAGMTPFNAFRRSATAELGPLEKEIQIAAVKAGSSQSLAEALSSINERIDSEILERTITLFEKSVRSGGQLAELLTAISEEVRRNQELKAELITSTRSYTMFLFFIILIVSPCLLAVSAQFLDIYSGIKGQFSGEAIEGYSLPFFSGQVVINSEYAIFISYMSLIGTAFFASVLMGVISRGKILYGVKYFPLLAIGSIIVFQIARSVTSGIFTNF
ncbi:MAG: type II secretion system F family protein [Candidatus Micrarchaeia archaeon]